MSTAMETISGISSKTTEVADGRYLIILDVEPVLGLLLTHLTEGRNPLKIAYDSGEIVEIGTAALGASLQSVLAYVAALVAHGVAAVECEIVGAVVGGRAKKLPVLILAEVL